MWPDVLRFDSETVVALAIVAGAIASVAFYVWGWVEIIDRTREVRDEMPWCDACRSWHHPKNQSCRARGASRNDDVRS